MRASLVALTLALAAPAGAAELLHLGTIQWGGEAINGVSGLEVSDDGSAFWAVSDQGWFLKGQFKRDGGRIADVILDDLLPIRGSDGLPVAARRVGDHADAEGLAMMPGDNGFYVTFERWARAARFDAVDQPADFIKDHPTFFEFRDNRQLEAAAISPDGRLHVFSELELKALGAVPVYVLELDGWAITGTIDRPDWFAIVGADFGPDGRLFLLERQLVLGLWWQSRIRLFETPSGSGEVIWTSNPGAYYNLEGLAVWRDDIGLRLTLVSDNNQNRNEPTQFVEFRLTE